MRKIIFSIFVVFLLLLISGCGNQKNSESFVKKEQPVSSARVSGQNPNPMSSKELVADKVQVFLFHATKRCSTCIAIGKLAAETVNERFQDELKSGKIEFREVNIDLPQNKELTEKFQAGGSALYLNAVRGLQDNIEQDAKVWRLTGNPVAFKDYLEDRINILLGK